MKFKFVTLAAILAAAGSAHAAIDNGAGGNGELFFNIWDANGSYTRSLETSINGFETSLSALGNLNLSWAADANFTNFLAGVADTTALKWNIMATDTVGARRLLTTYSLPEVSPTKTNDVIRSAALTTQNYVNNVNNALSGGADSVIVNAASPAWAGKSAFNDNVAGFLNFSNAGTLANNSFASGLGFMKIDALGTGTANSAYNEYLDNTFAVNAYIDSGNTLRLAAFAPMAPVPEPETIAMMLAGLGLIGSVIHRRRRAQQG